MPGWVPAEYELRPSRPCLPRNWIREPPCWHYKTAARERNPVARWLCSWPTWWAWSAMAFFSVTSLLFASTFFRVECPDR